MKSFKKKVLASAVLASMAGAAHAVYVDPNGQGQVLMYPYYTVNGGHNTYVSVVNTTTAVKVVKVRFREGKASRDVLDFNLFLSPNDVWTGAVIPSPSSSAARLITSDVSCTTPAIPAAGVDFRNFDYLTAANTSAAGTGLDRTREGYLEMIEMGTLDPAVAPGNGAVHSATTGVPTCAGLRNNDAGIDAAILPATGGLNGTATLINVANGQDSGYNATALASVFAGANYFPAEIPQPDFVDATPLSTIVSGNVSYTSLFSGARAGVDAVSSTLMNAQVINEYVLDTSTASQTDWVMTFPTKAAYVTTSGASSPFSSKFTSSGACEDISFQFFDREERSVTPGGDDFSPRPPSAPGAALCWESTVLSIRNGQAHMPTGSTSGVLGSVNSNQVTVLPTFQNGWATMTFTGTNATGTGIRAVDSLNIDLSNITGDSTPATFFGLPVVGFMVRTFNNGTLGNFQANYGSAFSHKYRQNITPRPPR